MSVRGQPGCLIEFQQHFQTIVEVAARAARSISAASDQTSTMAMASHRTQDRRKPLRSGVLGDVSGFSVTFQNNSRGWADLARDRGVLRSVQASRAKPVGPESI